MNLTKVYHDKITCTNVQAIEYDINFIRTNAHISNRYEMLCDAARKYCRSVFINVFMNYFYNTADCGEDYGMSVNQNRCDDRCGECIRKQLSLLNYYDDPPVSDLGIEQVCEDLGRFLDDLDI